jgi:hypothetical protein
MPEEAIAALGAWIDDGAPPCGGGDVPLISPQGPIDFGGPPGHYTSERPSSAPEGECSSQHWWTGDNSGNPHMRPGWDCIDCHRQEGPDFAYAGTVHASLTDPDDCRGVPGVKVELLDGNDQVFATTTTNLAGNFFFDEDVSFREFRARLTYQGRTREMGSLQGYGGCNSCHSPSGDGGAPGRIVAP